MARALSFSLVLVFAVSCKSEKAAKPAAPQVTEHQSLVATDIKLPLGASCDDVGRAGCAGGVCLKVGGERGKGRQCSRSCAKDRASCGPGYACAQIFPSDDAWYCAPVTPVTP